ncbi:MAG: DUF4384 domain-containing protein, partial [Planctomycetales bacterium]|nr:DUF4384 domain-containing protein [Planctomycetales bacterium]
MNSSRCFLMLLAFSLPGMTAFAQGPDDMPQIDVPDDAAPADETPRPETPENVEPAKPAFYVRAALDRVDGVYYEGDTVSLKVVSERDAYVYVLYRQVDDQVYQIYPNSAHPDNRVQAKQPVVLGAADDSFRWRVVPPFGKESITVIASERPIEDLSKKEHVAREFNPVSGQALKGIAVDILESDPSTWAKTKIFLDIRERPEEPKPDPRPTPNDNPPVAQGRRLGLFIGVSQYMFAKEALSAQKRFNADIERTPDIVGPSNGAEVLGDLMRKECRLDEVKILANEAANRVVVEEAISEWLPKTSRPGDTIFIYYSGHSIKIPDDNGDEQDKLDEVITMHDTMNGLEILLELIVQLKDADFPPEKKLRLFAILARIGQELPLKTPPTEELNIVQRGAAIVQEAFKNKDAQTLEKVALLMIRETSITDDLMG